MTPEEALVMIETFMRESPERLVQTSNTLALEAARWAQQAIVRDRKIYAEVQEIKKILMRLAKMGKPGAAVEAPEAEEPVVAAPAATNGTNGVHAVDPSTLKGEDLEAYMDAMLNGEPPNASAPAASKPFGAPAQTEENNEPLVAAEEAPVSKPEGVVVVPAAAAKAKARAAQAPGNAAPKA